MLEANDGILYRSFFRVYRYDGKTADFKSKEGQQ